MRRKDFTDWRKHRSRNRRILRYLVVSALVLLLFSSCSMIKNSTGLSDNFRNYYEIFVRSFYDQNSDGIGDLAGVAVKLDYIEKDVGADGIWLMPVFPSPSYHKYDVTDYYTIDPQYGTLQDFDILIAKAHKQDVRIILDLVLNHTSNLHPWFDSAVKALWSGEQSKYTGYYNFTLTDPGQGYSKITDKYYYECRFVSGMPDLNLDNAEVREEIVKIAKFWLDRGVDGFRLDAATSYYTGDHTKNIAFLTWFSSIVKDYKPDAYLVGEVWSDAGTVSEYYKSGIDSFFNFPYSQATGELVATLNTRMGESFAKDLSEWNRTITKNNPAAKDALFLSNHDNARSAGFLMRNLQKEKMAAALYLLAPGNPFIYYGEEIGMTGSGKDENKRLPMLWSETDKTGIPVPPPNATQALEGVKGADTQIKDESSLLHYYKKILDIKKKYPEIARGVMEPISTGNQDVAAFSVSYKEKKVFVLHNLSDEPRQVVLKLLDPGKLSVSAYLAANGGKPEQSSDTVTLPPMSSTILSGR